MTSRRKLYALGEPFGECCTRIEAGRLICGGGDGGSSSSSTTTQTTSTTTNVDKRMVAGDGSVGVSSDQSTVNVTMLDEGAVDKAISLVRDAGVGALDAYKSLLATTLALEAKNADSIQANTTLANALLETTETTTATAADAEARAKALKTGGLVIAGIAALAFYGK